MQCTDSNGQCTCTAGYKGMKYDSACGCNTTGSSSTACDQSTGQCTCNACNIGYTGITCNSCDINYYRVSDIQFVVVMPTVLVVCNVLILTDNAGYKDTKYDTVCDCNITDTRKQ